uniref:Reverse transcriptase domain-containing protein n=1 Tax=Tanacetum cinerariifolium TaxID=118510 RepID=A0A699GIZ5_TANCI|nr:reverse transcriptase domain-containing protein [Tanacetum cinerariifolium]
MKQWEELIRENVFGLGRYRDRLIACLAHMLYCVVAEEQYNLAYFFVKRIECARATPTANIPYGMFLTHLYRYIMETYPHFDNDTYDLVERVMRPLALRQTRRPRSDHGKARRSVSSLSSHHQGTSSHQHDDDDDVETSRASTSSPTTYLNSLNPLDYQNYQMPSSSEQTDESLFARQTTLLNRTQRMHKEMRGRFKSFGKTLKGVFSKKKKASISKASKRPKINIIPPKQLFVGLTQDNTKTPSPKLQLFSPSAPNAPSKTQSIKDTSSSLIDYTPKSPTLSSFPSINAYLNPPLSPPPRVPPPPPTQATQENASMDITLTLSPITLIDIKAVKNWKAPRTPTEVRSFLRLAGYYRRFIDNFSKIAKSLTILNPKCKSFCGRMFLEESDKVEKYVGGLPDMIHWSVMESKPKTMHDAIEFATELMDKKIRTLAERQAKNKRKSDNNNQAQQQLLKSQNVAQAYADGTSKRKEYIGTLPLCNKCKFHHNGQCTGKYYKLEGVGLEGGSVLGGFVAAAKKRTTKRNQGHYKSDCPELNNRNHENQAEGTETHRMVYALGGGETDQDPNNIKDEIEA